MRTRTPIGRSGHFVSGSGSAYGCSDADRRRNPTVTRLSETLRKECSIANSAVGLHLILSDKLSFAFNYGSDKRGIRNVYLRSAIAYNAFNRDVFS